MRKSFAALLIGSWISLSGIDDLLQDPKLPTQVNLQLSGEPSHPRRDLANGILEFPDWRESYRSPTYELAGVVPAPDHFTVEQKAGRLYKVLRVFLI